MDRASEVTEPQRTQPTALVVEPIPADALMLEALLVELGFRVTTVGTFAQAKQALSVPPQLLVTALRLGEYNGLQLVLRGKSSRPNMAAIVTTDIRDAVLQSEAEQMGATFVLKPTTTAEWKASVCRTVAREPGGPGAPPRAPFERRTGDRRAASPAVVDVNRRVRDRRHDTRDIIQRLVIVGTTRLEHTERL